jgi:hypothetical protein
MLFYAGAMKDINLATGDTVGLLEDTREKNSELESKFNALVKTWQQETAGCSLTTRRYAHRAYQSILVLGPAVVPLILRELQERPDWWFEALKALTNQDPTKPTDNFHNAVKAWIRWAQEQKPIE